MIDKIIKEVKKQNERNFNNEGYKIIAIDVNINENEQIYTLTFRNRNFIENTFICNNVNSLYNLLKGFGFDNILEIK